MDLRYRILLKYSTIKTTVAVASLKKPVQWENMLPGQWFKVVNRNGEQFYGLMGSRATHGLPQDLKSKTMNISELYLDMGVENKQQLVDLEIEEGNMVVPMPHFQIMNHTDRVVIKAFDDRVGTYIMIGVAKALEKKHTPLYLANKVQEEPGLKGCTYSNGLCQARYLFCD